MAEPPDILLVEDDEDDVSLFRDALRDSGFQPKLTVAGDGEDALRILRSGRQPDLVLLDLHLPRIDGHQVLREVRGDPSLARIPIIVFTTSGRREDIEGAYDRGANAYIQKPMSFDRLIEVTKRLEDFWFRFVTAPPRV